ncbi:hypothetical protein [Intestinibacter sp.]|uniref:hypothetical protein n=1 Tax=Intestinibacter sp. TaxID=1965304 RepID=UPI002A75EDC7|nr:hypothetical protein [Intestinibacter sp.]MDY2734969.1 hypothetical protein [Intestinibacter sp.]
MKITKICTLALIIFIVSVNLGFCYDENSNDEITPFLTYISSYDCGLEIISGNAKCTSYIDGNSKVTSTKISMVLQKLSSGSWIDVVKCDKTGGNSCSLEKSYEIGRGTYRVYCTFKANSETATKKTVSKTY